jgi:two-component system, cell cycle response regulator
MVVAPQTPHQNAVELAERLRMRIETNSLYLTNTHDGTQEVQLTCSAGVASLEGELDSMEKLVHLADDNLYRAKNAGRNCVIAD